jgi:hypothetical protein
MQYVNEDFQSEFARGYCGGEASDFWGRPHRDGDLNGKARAVKQNNNQNDARRRDQTK